MTQLEIATQIFCSGKADEINYAWQLAGELIELDKELQKGLYESLEKALDDDFLTEKDENNLSQRTAERTQQLIDLGFEWDEELKQFEDGDYTCSNENIEKYDDEDWNDFINLANKEDESIGTAEYKAIEETLFTHEDFFKGNPYIEFEMPNTVLRLYRMDKQIEAEKDLQVTKKTESKYIMTHAENKEFELGITIFKK